MKPPYPVDPYLIKKASCARRFQGFLKARRRKARDTSAPGPSCSKNQLLFFAVAGFRQLGRNAIFHAAFVAHGAALMGHTWLVKHFARLFFDETGGAF